jgi:putative colanic acid biosynthesis glycosyltransferase
VVKDNLGGLQETFASLERLSGVDFQYIVINGSESPDKAEEIKTMTNRIDVLINEKDAGIYDAMNKGLNLCDGEWVHFLNAGDVYLEVDALEEVVACMKQNLDFVFCDVLREFSDGERKLWKQHYPLRYGIFKNICHQAIWYNLKKNPQLRYDAKYKISADCHLLMQLLMKKDFECFYHPKALTSFKLGGLSQRYAGQALKERWTSFNEIFTSPVLRGVNKLNLMRQMLKLKRQQAKSE